MKRIHLLACDQCKRQLDVTALELGDEVQCVCHAVHTVGEPKLVQVRGLACGRCGGVLQEGDKSCSYCKAMLAPEERTQTTLCPVCATRLPNDSHHCNKCGVSIRVTAVPAIPKGGQCPRCKAELRIHLLENAEVIECAGAGPSSTGGCGGMWCSRDTFERLVQNVKRAVSDGSVGSLAEAQTPPSQSSVSHSTASYIPCLQCGQFMARRQYRYKNRPSRIVIDVCRDHGVWFDRDELQGILAFIREQLTTDTRIDAPTLEWTSQSSDGVGIPPARKPHRPVTKRRDPMVLTPGDSPLEALLYWVSDFFLGD